MLITIDNILDDARLKTVHKLLESARFVDGKLSAGMVAKRVKNNEEVAQDDKRLQQLNNIVMASLVSNPVYQSVVLPLRVATPFYARYGSGMTYGDHVDDPVMGPMQQRYRSDVSTTVFLNNPDDYEGGELVINTSFGQQSLKLPAGQAVVYPSSSLHHVNEVTNGERVVAVTWAQSMVREPAKRELLHELNQARDALLKADPESMEAKKVDVSYVNLVRMWAEV